MNTNGIIKFGVHRTDLTLFTVDSMSENSLSSIPIALAISPRSASGTAVVTSALSLSNRNHMTVTVVSVESQLSDSVE